MATNTKLEDIILRAVDIVASQKIAKAGYDKTIQATIVSCIDPTIGKYKVKYQDSYWIAYGGTADTYYSPNTSVYILIPGGDMSKDKTILGTTKRLGVNYITVAQGDQRYAPIGSNVINTNSTWNLCSYKTETKILYSVDYTAQQNLLQIDTNAVSEYIKNSTSIIAGAYVKNNLETQQKFQGNYGIVFGLDFTDPATYKTVTRYYTIDVDSMNGNPYNYPNEIRQYNTFEIDGENFLRINVIAIFTKDFPIQKNNMPDDIFISKIELNGAMLLDQQDLNSCALVMLTPKGYIFSQNSANTDTRTFEAQLRVKGKIIDIKSQKVDFYWFIENISITAASSKYNKYGGQGWQCLNNYQIIKNASTSGGVTTPAIYKFIPGSNIFSVKKSDVLAEVTKYKCVAIYDNTVLSKEVKIVRNDAQYKIEITSSQGTQFYNSAGTTNLTCTCKLKSNNTDVNINTLDFVWATVNNSGSFSSLPTTTEYNDDKTKLNAIRDAILGYIDAEYLLNQTIYNVSSLLPADSTINAISDSTQRSKVSTAKAKLTSAGLTSTSNITTILNKYNVATSGLTYKLVADGDENHLNSLKAVINSYNSIQVVSENKVSGVQINNITNFIIFKCSVYTKTGNNYLGSASITLTNSANGNEYSLIINEGTQVFKYNTHGVSPASNQYENPQTIPALTFTIYDNSGNQIEEEVLKNADITWIVPNSNTLIRTDAQNGIVNEISQTISYKTMNLIYSIAQNYSMNNSRNNIELKVVYNGLNLFAKTNFSFLKQGENSTNGTDFVCKIVPNVLSGDTPVNPTIYYNGSSTSFNWNTDRTNNKWFKAQLWHNGTKIFESTESGNSTEAKPVTIDNWEVLKNKYDVNKSDSTNLNTIKGTSTGSWSFSFTPNTFSSSYSSSTYPVWRPANILKVTLSYDNMTYYATLPIIVCRIFNNNYLVNLKDYSGFREVVYTSSGQSPLYDSHAPFEILTSYKTGNNWEDISTKTTAAYKLNYEWYYLGSVWNRNSSNTWVEDVETTSSTAQTGDSSKKWLEKRTLYNNTTIPLNQKSIKPVDSYNGECVNTALACRVYLNSNSTTIAWIHIPIHMMRNRFENSAINGWDGNSVNLGGDNGGMILAPQVGAGIKDSNNRFTGIFMGVSKDPQQALSSAYSSFATTNEDVGLFGYNSGSRTIFLDAKTGKAVFGQRGQAQIKLDPTETINGRASAKIYSGNYVYSPGDTTSTNAGTAKRTSTGTGMLIDLSTPEVKFGSGNFEVDSTGHIIARGGGEIAGWQITDNAMFNKRTASGVSKNTTGMNSNPNIDSTSTSSNNTGNGSEYRAVSMPPTTTSQGTSGYKTVGKAAAFWAGGTKFFVTHDGYLKAQEASIGSGSKPIFIGKSSVSGSNESAIFSGLKSSKTASQSGFYLGTDGIAIGATASVSTGTNTTQTVSNFQVDSDGTLFARKGYIGNGRTGWQIGSNYLRNGKTSIDDLTNASGVYIGTDGISLGRRVNGNTNVAAFKVTSAGVLTAKSGTIGNWTINNNSISSNGQDYYYSSGTTVGTSGIYFGSGGLRMGANFHVDSSGNLYANNGTFNGTVYATDGTFDGTITSSDGKIGNWFINNNSISSNGQDYYYSSGTTVATSGMYFGSGGLRMGSNFHVDSSGNLYANNGTFNGIVYASSGTFSGTLTSSEGNIAGWKIKTNALIKGADTEQNAYNTTGTMYFGTQGLSIGKNFVVSSTGKLTCIEGQITSSYTDSSNKPNEVQIGQGRVKFYRSQSSSSTGEWAGELCAQMNTRTYSGDYGTAAFFSIDAYDSNVIDGVQMVLLGSSGGTIGRYAIYNQYTAQNSHYGKNCVVEGGMHLGGGLYSNNDIELASGATVRNSSDERLKNIVETDFYLDDFILSLQPIKYSWKENKNFDKKMYYYGLGAQTTLRKMKQYNIDGNLVYYQEKRDSYSIAYSQLAPMMLGTVQKNREKINQLEQQIKILQDMIKDIKGV